ncbi:dTDP-4-dehydrorhamnose 3,5-epimerase [Actinophytocola xinjiangensis]|uniref:dTDP-4-dehydrorhamnose 3,5-epimerase n=1 Tax=Actinophytocola xinjiangensis TaxID=485602 RepID=A0A7Z0WTE5_9PSEU|nr:dTDP-4-dehydrorhamnose 3,5-epimerase family protein [Actinophytocola xinjiangensis]OLF14592.1 dTDP-4-dehydrorhamnose 3,5-epimerase [Actinophytocola xinjiangensis]
MKVRELGVVGAFEFTPPVHGDDRGLFVSPFLTSAFEETLDRVLFPVRQMSYSVSQRGVVRGVHYTTTPPGAAKYVTCPHGTVLDVIVDLRRGSPTFGEWDSLVLDWKQPRGVYFPTGVGHMFVALADDSVVAYSLSTEYIATNEQSVSVLDPELKLPIPDDIEPMLSPRDTTADTLAEALAKGSLPDYETCLALDEGRLERS